MKAGLIDEMMSDAIDDAVDGEDVEQETDAEVDKVGPQLPEPPATRRPEDTHAEGHHCSLCSNTKCAFCRGVLKIRDHLRFYFPECACAFKPALEC